MEYEGLPVICFTCGRYGHNSNTCKEADAAKEAENPPQPTMHRQGDHAHQEVACHDANMVEPFGPWMITTRKGRRTNKGMENNIESFQNREPFEASTSRFHVLAQTLDEREDHAPTVAKDIPSTSHQPPMHTLNPIFTSQQETMIRTGIRRKPRNKVVLTKSKGRNLTTSMNPNQNPFQSSDFFTSEKDADYTPHANRNPSSLVTPQFEPTFQ